MGRAKERAVIAGLDVGTTKICCVIAEPTPVGGLDIVGVGVSPSRGLRKGVVVNIDSTVESVRRRWRKPSRWRASRSARWWRASPAATSGGSTAAAWSRCPASIAR